MRVVFHPVRECSPVSPGEFRRDYFDVGAPVVLRGLIRSWPACDTWSPASLAARFPRQPVEVMVYGSDQAPLGASPYRERRRLPLGDVVALMGAPAGQSVHVVAQSQLLADPSFSDLWSDMDFAPEWFDRSAKSTHVALWMSPQGAVTPLHFDRIDSLLAQVCGSKRVIIASPDDTGHLYKGPAGYSFADPESPASDAFPRLAHARWQETVLWPGDALFLPNGWWHHVRSLTASISLSLRNFAWSSPLSPT